MARRPGRYCREWALDASLSHLVARRHGPTISHLFPRIDCLRGPRPALAALRAVALGVARINRLLRAPLGRAHKMMPAFLALGALLQFLVLTLAASTPPSGAITVGPSSTGAKYTTLAAALKDTSRCAPGPIGSYPKPHT